MCGEGVLLRVWGDAFACGGGGVRVGGDAFPCVGVYVGALLRACGRFCMCGGVLLRVCAWILFSSVCGSFCVRVRICGGGACWFMCGEYARVYVCVCP